MQYFSINSLESDRIYFYNVLVVIVGKVRNYVNVDEKGPKQIFTL